MKPGRKIVIASIAILVFMVACAPNSRMNVLSFFFDGVPKPDTSETVQPDRLSVSQQSFSEDTLIQPIASLYTYHKPYQEKKCTSCHDKNAVGILISKEPELCYGCHEDFNKKFSTLHGPVDVGFCSSCHKAHLSKNAGLLVEPGNNLCFPCHIASEVERPKAHIDIDDALCISCHDPHGHNKIIRKAIPIGR